MSNERSTQRPTMVSGPGAECTQMMGELVRADVELAVAQRLIVEDERDGVRGELGLRGEQRRDGGVWNGVCGVVPRREDGAALVRRQDVEVADRNLGCRHGSREQPFEARRHRRHGRFVEQVGGIFEQAREPGRAAIGVALLGQCERQVELGARHRDVFERGAQSRQVEIDLGVVLERQHHLEQRMMRQRACRVEHFHQPLERQVLVAVGDRLAARTRASSSAKLG